MAQLVAPANKLTERTMVETRRIVEWLQRLLAQLLDALPKLCRARNQKTVSVLIEEAAARGDKFGGGVADDECSSDLAGSANLRGHFLHSSFDVRVVYLRRMAHENAKGRSAR